MVTAQQSAGITNWAIGVGELNAGAAANLSSPPHANTALDAFLANDPARGLVFNAASWLSAVKASASWADASWAEASWADASWAEASWADASWAEASWADARGRGAPGLRPPGPTPPGPTPRTRTAQGQSRCSTRPTSRPSTAPQTSLPHRATSAPS